MGSVKDLIVIEEPKDEILGRGRFVFSDRYSVFDYGVMPDEIDGKGASLCMISAFFFERLEDMGFKTHYVGLIENGRVKRIDELEEPTNVMEVKLVRVLKPERKDGEYDYSVIRNAKGNYLIPLEIIYRNALPEGSSVFRRLERGEITIEQLGLDHYPKPGEWLERPIIDVSTKLEDKDRYLSWDEAKEIAGLSDDEVKEIRRWTIEIDELITKEVEKARIENLDGKFEFAFDPNRDLMVVDEVGTPDGCRFSIDGFQISKEVLRRWYRKTDWYRKLEEVKGKPNWRELAGTPPKLPEDLLKTVSDMYKACCNEILGRKMFDVDGLREIVKRLRELIE